MIKYQKYKGINILWAKEIPSHWHICRISNIFGIRREKNKPVRTEEVLSLSAMYGVSLYSDKKEKGGNKPKEDFSSYNLCYPGDILVNCMNIVSGAVGISKYFGAVSPVYYPLVNLDKEKYDTRFMEYIFRNYNFQRGLVGIGKGIQMSEAEDGRLFTVRMRISWENLKVQMLIVPTIEEQEHIANYLDWKIREIDKLIEIEKQQIEDIERLKKIMISQYYIELPIKRRIKTLIQSPLVYGINEAGKMNGKIRFVRITDIEKNGSLKKDGKQYINNCEKKYILEKGDILFARSGGTVGKTYIHQDISNNELMAFAGYLIRARFDVNLVNPEYIYYYTQSESYTEWKNSIFIQSTIQNISAEKYSNLEIPYCSLNIQNKIVDKIKQKLLEINKLKEKSLEKQLYLVNLKESIISEVVTGQIDVRNVKIPERE